jgi:hypothetical protein
MVGHKSDYDIMFNHFSFVEGFNRLNCSNGQKKLAGTWQHLIWIAEESAAKLLLVVTCSTSFTNRHSHKQMAEEN